MPLRCFPLAPLLPSGRGRYRAVNPHFLRIALLAKDAESTNWHRNGAGAVLPVNGGKLHSVNDTVGDGHAGTINENRIFGIYCGNWTGFY